MDFRILVASLLLWLSPAYSLTQDQFNQLNQTVFQYPTSALDSIYLLEKKLDSHPPSDWMERFLDEAALIRLIINFESQTARQSKQCVTFISSRYRCYTFTRE